MAERDAPSDPDGKGDPGLNFEWSPEVVQLINEALTESGEIYELSARVKSALPNELADHYKAFLRALDYHAPRSASRPDTIDDTYGPMFTTGAGLRLSRAF